MRIWAHTTIGLSKIDSRTCIRRVIHCRPFSAHTAAFPARTHTCGQLSADDVGKRVTLAGWLLPERKVSKRLSFFPLRDSSGTTQLVVPTPKNNHEEPTEADLSPTALTTLSQSPVESAVLIQGEVRLRPENQRRPEPAGSIEVVVDAATLLNPAMRPLPFYASDPSVLASEDLRAKYRYLDLRRPALAANLRRRSDVAHLIRSELHSKDFLEVETPMLLKSTPEGAREFLVPSRLGTPERPSFYALPQSPQQPKQLLAVSGAADRYFQLARCFRDEDGRRDRQPEFTQVDLELAFVSWSPRPGDTTGWRIGGTEVREVIEDLVARVWKETLGVNLPTPFRVITYDDAMARYGSDKPDTRFGLEIRSLARGEGQVLEYLVVRQSADTEFYASSEELVSSAPNLGLRAFRASEKTSLSEVLGDFVSDKEQGSLAGVSHDNLNEALAIEGDDVVFVARRRDPPEGGNTALGRLRLQILERAIASGSFTPPKEPQILWVTEFPLFTRADEDKTDLSRGRWASSHHPFTAPVLEDVQALLQSHAAGPVTGTGTTPGTEVQAHEERIRNIKGQHFDLVLDGVELGGGSVRVHDPVMQAHIFSNILRLDERETAGFQHLLHALACGAPPHGGIALGFDRMMAILCGTNSIRDVIAFPKTGAGTDALFKSPAPAEERALREYNIRALKQ